MTDPTEQVRFYSQAILLKPDFAAALINRGVARALQGNQASALQDYDEACRAQPDSAVAFHNRGIARELQGDLAGARQDYDEAIRLRADDPMFTSNLYLRAGLSFAKADPGRRG